MVGYRHLGSYETAVYIFSTNVLKGRLELARVCLISCPYDCSAGSNGCGNVNSENFFLKKIKKRMSGKQLKNEARPSGLITFFVMEMEQNWQTPILSCSSTLPGKSTISGLFNKLKVKLIETKGALFVQVNLSQSSPNRCPSHLLHFKPHNSQCSSFPHLVFCGCIKTTAPMIPSHADWGLWQVKVNA